MFRLHPLLHTTPYSGAVEDKTLRCSNCYINKINHGENTVDIRSKLNADQLMVLYNYFYNISDRPTTFTMIGLSKRTGVVLDVVRNWFRNRRMNDKKRIRRKGRDRRAHITDSARKILENVYEKTSGKPSTQISKRGSQA